MVMDLVAKHYSVRRATTAQRQPLQGEICSGSASSRGVVTSARRREIENNVPWQLPPPDEPGVAAQARTHSPILIFLLVVSNPSADGKLAQKGSGFASKGNASHFLWNQSSTMRRIDFA